MLKTPANPGGTPIEVFDQLRAGVLADRSQFCKDLSLPFYGYNRPGAKVSEGVRESFWLQGMMAGFPASYFCIKAFSETDLTEDLKKFDVPTLILHGDDDQIVPIGASALLSSKLVKGADAEGLQGRAARHVHDAQGPGQRGPARVHQGMTPHALAETLARPVIQPAVHAFMAKRADARKASEIKGASHVVMISYPARPVRQCTVSKIGFLVEHQATAAHAQAEVPCNRLLLSNVRRSA